DPRPAAAGAAPRRGFLPLGDGGAAPDARHALRGGQPRPPPLRGGDRSGHRGAAAGRRRLRRGGRPAGSGGALGVRRRGRGVRVGPRRALASPEMSEDVLRGVAPDPAGERVATALLKPVYAAGDLAFLAARAFWALLREPWDWRAWIEQADRIGV